MFNIFGRPLEKVLRSAPPERKSRPDHGGHWLMALMESAASFESWLQEGKEAEQENDVDHPRKETRVD